MGDRHLARTEAVETDLVLHVDQLGVRLGIEIGCRDVDLELVLQSLIEGFRDLHNSLPPWSGQSAPTLSSTSRGKRLASRNPKCKRLVRAEGLEPPQLSSLEPKSSASTSSATPASLAAAVRGRRLITWASTFAAKKWAISAALAAPETAGQITPKMVRIGFMARDFLRM